MSSNLVIDEHTVRPGRHYRGDFVVCCIVAFKNISLCLSRSALSMNQRLITFSPRLLSRGYPVFTRYTNGLAVTQVRKAPILLFRKPPQAIRMLGSTTPSTHGIPLAFASCSIGGESDGLHRRIEAIASAGFAAIELSFPDLQTFASQFLKREVKEDNYDDLCQAAEEVRRMCESHGLKILMLQPFSNFEGWKRGTKEREQAWERVKGWVRIMEACGTDLLQVGIRYTLTNVSMGITRVGWFHRYSRRQDVYRPGCYRQRPPRTV